MSTETETDVLAGLDFDMELPCEAAMCRDGDVACSQTARWSATKQCGCPRFLACDAYRSYILAGLKNHQGGWYCVDCNAMFLGADSRINFAPIASRS